MIMDESNEDDSASESQCDSPYHSSNHTDQSIENKSQLLRENKLLINSHSKKLRTNNYLSYEQKIQIIYHKRENPTISQKELALWAQEFFGLENPLTQGTISNILKDSSRILETNDVNLKSRRKRKLSNEKLDYALGLWVHDMLSTNTKVTGENIINKAKEFVRYLKDTDPTLNNQASSFPEFSSGWLGSFKDRHGIRLSRVGMKNRLLDNNDHFNHHIGRQMDTHFSNEIDSQYSNQQTSAEYAYRNDLTSIYQTTDDDLDANEEIEPSTYQTIKTNEDYIKLAEIEINSSFKVPLNTSTPIIYKNQSKKSKSSSKVIDNYSMFTLQEKKTIIDNAILILQDMRLSTTSLKNARLNLDKV